MFPQLQVTPAAPDRLVRVVSLNVAGLRAAMKKGLVDYLNLSAVDVLCLQEVKCSESCADELAPLLSLFRFHYWCSGSKPGYPPLPLTLTPHLRTKHRHQVRRRGHTVEH